MIKFVLQAIAFYVMSIFRLPNTLLDEIEKMMNVTPRSPQRNFNINNQSKLTTEHYTAFSKIS